ncbi:hypothetical protein ANN_04935 [Periplaneta americana]|uniref:Uncharacterized protein n=1 Tax=Periplaneta americana TaxID=6978 RepID=A0ABQ8TBT9_PERAM|nr:hypothetical protein ANN_04935 [Periplaneta americana]
MAGLCEGGNEPSGSLKAIFKCHNFNKRVAGVLGPFNFEGTGTSDRYLQMLEEDDLNMGVDRMDEDDDNDCEMNPIFGVEIYIGFAPNGLRKYPGKTSAKQLIPTRIRSRFR